jgi:SAM-dependent methyltransferase
VAELIGQCQLDVRTCDIEREPLPFADGSFACALLCETFEHLRVDPLFTVSEIHRVLQPGGRLLLTTPNVYSLPTLGRILLGRSYADPYVEFSKLRDLGHMGHVREYAMKEVTRFLVRSGFSLEMTAYRSTGTRGGRLGRVLKLAYRVLPRFLRREIVVVARKTGEGARLTPLR